MCRSVNVLGEEGGGCVCFCVCLCVWGETCVCV